MDQNPDLPKVLPRIPPAVNGIQVNFCKNPICSNYGWPASEEAQPRGRKAAGDERGDTYTLSGIPDGVAIKCKRCGEYPTLKNRSIL
jgi:hypothetical protein